VRHSLKLILLAIRHLEIVYVEGLTFQKAGIAEQFELNWKVCVEHYREFQDKDYVFIDAPEDITGFAPVITDSHESDLGWTIPAPWSWSPMFDLLHHSQVAVNKSLQDWQRYVNWVDAISRTHTIISGCIYAAARITILVLAFTTLRKQDERLYTDTWARFLPSNR
jgi:hypothetical protein